MYCVGRCKILIIRLSSLGDIVLTEPCIRLLKMQYPDCIIHYLTKPQYVDLVSQLGQIDKIYTWSKDAIHSVFFKTLKKEKYDVIIDLQNKLTTFIIKLLLRNRKTKIITYNKQHFLRWLIVHKLSSKNIDSVVWNYLEVFKRIPPPTPLMKGSNVGAMSSSSATSNDYCRYGDHLYEDKKLYYPTLRIDSDALKEVKQIFENYHIPADKYLIGIFPGSQHVTKQYPIEKYANFMLDVPDNWGCVFLILGDWKDKYHAVKLRSLTGMNIYDLTGAFDIPQLIAATSLLKIIISNDSGPMHIAAALKKPQIAIFGATHTNLGFRPLNDNATIIQKNLPCQPCSLHGGKECPKYHLNCLNEIQSDELFEVFKEVFEESLLRV